MKKIIFWLCLILAVLAMVPAVFASAVSADGYYNGIFLGGKVKVVDHFPDIKVKVVSAFPDLRVREVSAFPDGPGEWQFVTYGEDFTVQFVDSFPDITIQYVDAFPGVP